jgi:hypothetical protein
VSFRLDAKGLKALDDIMTYFGLTSNNKNENFRGLVTRLTEIINDAKNVQTLNAAAITTDIDIQCPARFKADKIIKDVNPQTNKTFFKHADCCFCFQFEKGKPKKPLELINALEQCKRCKPLMDAWQKAQHEIVNINANAISDLPEPEPELPAPKTDGSFQSINWNLNPVIHCERRHCDLHYTRCLNRCKKETAAVYFACRAAHPELAQRIDVLVASESGLKLTKK